MLLLSVNPLIKRFISDVTLEIIAQTNQSNLTRGCWIVAKSHAQNMNQEYIQHISSVFLGVFSQFHYCRIVFIWLVCCKHQTWFGSAGWEWNERGCLKQRLCMAGITLHRRCGSTGTNVYQCQCAIGSTLLSPKYILFSPMCLKHSSHSWALRACYSYGMVDSSQYEKCMRFILAAFWPQCKTTTPKLFHPTPFICAVSLLLCIA